MITWREIQTQRAPFTMMASVNYWIILAEMMKLNYFWCVQSSSVKSQKVDCKFEQQQTRIQQNRLHTQCCLLGPVNVYCLKGGKICIWGCTPSCWGQSPVWVLSNSNRLSRFSDFIPLSLGLSTDAFKAWFCVQVLGRDGFLLWTVLLSSNCCLLLSHLLSNGLLFKHLQAMLL